MDSLISSSNMLSHYRIRKRVKRLLGLVQEALGSILHPHLVGQGRVGLRVTNLLRRPTQVKQGNCAEEAGGGDLHEEM